jgi:hypothetical protein
MLDPDTPWRVMESTLRAVDQTHRSLKKLFLHGVGLTFFAIGFVVVVAAIALRIVREDQITTAAFFGILVIGVLLMAMAFAFFVFDLRGREKTLESLNSQSEQVTEALVQREAAIRAEKEKTKKEGLPAGVDADRKYDDE